MEHRLAGLSPAFAQMFPPGQQPGSSGSKGNQTSIYQSPFAAHPRSNNLAPGAKGSIAATLLNGMPALPMASQAMNVRSSAPCIPAFKQPKAGLMLSIKSHIWEARKSRQRC